MKYQTQYDYQGIWGTLLLVILVFLINDLILHFYTFHFIGMFNYMYL